MLRPVGCAPAGALVGGANGALAGWCGIYDWHHPKGWVAAALDSTWGLVGVTGGLALHAVNAAPRDAGYVDDLSRRQNRFVYERGWSPRRRFAFTAGNVVTGAGDPTNPRRRQLVERHEDLHVWQGRWFGPFYPALYAAWMAGGTVAGTWAWARRKEPSLFQAVERRAYYYNPFERRAYAADDNWPPRRLQAMRSGERDREPGEAP
ncbi:MAG: hypothetical protein SGJ13_17340 [Actinomycetota bacterium]|nr:hypothetical protein [Actinomycetota bacterium]